ncbi:MAG: DinB family protein [Bacteroidota bacterium]
MTKSELDFTLSKAYQTVVDYFISLDEASFIQSQDGKWAPGQHLEHLLKSVRPVSLAFGLPSLVTRLFFGRAHGTSRSYDELVQAYKQALASGAKASRPYIPKRANYKKQKAVARSLNRTVATLSRRIHQFSEPQLDRLRLPHPILGKITLREMLYFTIYHAEHHLQGAKVLQTH